MTGAGNALTEAEVCIPCPHRVQPGGRCGFQVTRELFRKQSVLLSNLNGSGEAVEEAVPRLVVLMMSRQRTRGCFLRKSRMLPVRCAVHEIIFDLRRLMQSEIIVVTFDEEPHI